jgi:hypothetical protein
VLVLKLLLVPGLVALVTLAVRRWGPTVGGWLTTMPVVAGPVIVFYALEQGAPFGARAAHGTVTGILATTGFIVAYARATGFLAWPGCVAIGWTVFGILVGVLNAADLSLTASVISVLAGTMLGRRLLPEAGVWSSTEASAEPLRGDLPLRMVAAAALVLALTGLAEALGPSLSGLLNAFPVLTTIVAAFTHAQRGRPATLAFLDAYLQSAVGFSLFCAVMAVSLTPFGLTRAIVLALAVQLASNACLWALAHQRPPVES